MPFENTLARSFTSTSIRSHAPPLPGVFGISNASEWIFIGKADNIQSALIDLLDGSDRSVTQRRPSGFAFEICYLERRRTRCERLVREYNPAYTDAD